MKEKETIAFIPDEKREKKIKRLIKEGYRWRCDGCGTVYKDKPETYESGQDCDIEMCRCGSDLFTDLGEILEKWCVIIRVEPVNETIILKEHNFKHCQCEKGKVWTGDAETECNAALELLVHWPDRKVYRCRKSGLKIVCLASTSFEIAKEKSKAYIRLPSDQPRV